MGIGRSWMPVLVVVLVALIAGVVGFGAAWLNPFQERTIDRSGPVVVKSIRDLSRYEAASGTFQVVVDLEKDTPFLPAIIRSTRTLFIGTGSVDAYVDFGRLASSGVRVSAGGDVVTVRLPRAQLEKPNLDNRHSYVVAERKGLTDRVEEVLLQKVDSRQELYLHAEKRILEAAKTSGLLSRAEIYTRSMITSLLRSLGFEKVTVKLADEP